MFKDKPDMLAAYDGGGSGGGKGGKGGRCVLQRCRAWCLLNLSTVEYLHSP